MNATEGWLSVAGAGVLLVLGSGCALLSKADPLTPRYFSPEPSGTGPGAGAQASRATDAEGRGALGPASTTSDTAPALRLGRVTSATYLGERLVYRSSTYELGFYEDRRWTERPEAYFRRSLSRALFEDGGFRRVVSGSGPTLEVELVELSELKGRTPAGRARVTYVLYDARSVQAEGTLTVELPIRVDGAVGEDEQAAASVGVLSSALAAAVSQVVDRVRVALPVAVADPTASSAK